MDYRREGKKLSSETNMYCRTRSIDKHAHPWELPCSQDAKASSRANTLQMDNVNDDMSTDIGKYEAHVMKLTTIAYIWVCKQVIMRLNTWCLTADDSEC